MHDVALGFLWQDDDVNVIERAREWSRIIERVYVIDLRERGESFASLPDARLHYAPFRARTSPGHGLNRALHLAYEDGRGWLWILDGRTDITREDLLLWSQRARPEVALYRAAETVRTLNPFSRPSCALLVSVAVARSIGGWSHVLPARQVLVDFEERLKAQGGTVEKSLKVRDLRSGAEQSGLWARIGRHFFRAGTKSR